MPQQISTTNETPILIFRGKPAGCQNTILNIVLICSAVFLPLSLGVWTYVSVYLTFGPIPAASWSRQWFILTIIAAICGIILLFSRRFRSRKQVKVYRQALYIHLSSIRKFYIKWNNISGILTSSSEKTFLGQSINQKIRITIILTNGKIISFGHEINGIQQLIREIKRNVYRRLYPTYLESLRNGNLIKQGSLAFNKTHFFRHNLKIQWKNVSDVFLKSGFLFISINDGRQFRWKISEIPNIELFFSLVTHGIHL
jgi:hypothetical protein